MTLRLTLLLFVVAHLAFAKDPYPKNENIDVSHYRFQLELSDSTDAITGEASITILFKKKTTEFSLDLIKEENGKGMTVKSIIVNGAAIGFLHQDGRVNIRLPQPVEANTRLTFTVNYSGVPQDGLIIGKNKFGDRTFFGDNWPDRGHHWLPCVDHPSDKARVDFVIIAPDRYQVVATGKQIEETNLSRHRKLTHWKENTDVAVKVMTIGVASFAVELSGESGDIPITTWVYPQNREDGFSDFAIAPKIFDFLQNYIGPYSYEKLAHVQSKTRFGGLENAGNIFYFEGVVNGKNEREGLIAHESAHQWFGNSVTENDWHHVWLSEGFATYFTSLYFEYAYGHDRLVQEQKTDRQQVIEYFKKSPSPVVDTTIVNINEVLSTNTYQKAGWVLHMLRHEIGDAAFHNGIKEYYRIYQNRNALTVDFRNVMENASGKNLSKFFDQWLYQSGHPQLIGTSTFDTKNKTVTVRVEQVQKGSIFETPLEIGIKTKGGMKVHTVLLKEKTGEFRIPAESKPLEIVADPGTWLLFEGEIKLK